MWQAAAVLSSFLLLFAPKVTPKFEEFRTASDWRGPNAPIKLRRADERLFRTQLTEAAKQPADFAGHYRFAGWGCGSVCAAGAVIDLQTGDVYPPPKQSEASGEEHWIFAGGVVSGEYLEVRPDSRLAVVRQQARDPQFQNVSYYEWMGDRFRLLAVITEKKP